jgi:hypothetical protein
MGGRGDFLPISLGNLTQLAQILLVNSGETDVGASARLLL